LAWRMTDGQYMSATPAHPEEAWQVLEELFKYRPDLRTPLPPLPPPPPPNERYPLAYGSHGASAPNESAQPDQNQTVMAGIAHLCNFFGGPILAYILWKINRKTAPYAAEQSRKAFYFQIVVTLALAVVGAIAFHQPISDEASATSVTGFVLWSALFVAVYIYAALFSVIGAVKAFHGQPFHYPLMGGI
jgi:uncharacterized Tic20 family protein